VGSGILAVVAAASLVAGCGIDVDESPRELSAVPFGLLDPSTTTTTERLTQAPRFQATSVYLLDNDDYLVEVRRQLPGEVRVVSSIGSLLTPPSEAEVNGGLRSAISSTTELRGVVGPEAGLVTIDLSSEMSDVSPESVRLALAQIVYTATAVPGVDRVLFQVDGQAREVPNGEGQSTAEPLGRIDYRQFVRPLTVRTVPDTGPTG
jgi:spore germination protein GerM